MSPPPTPHAQPGPSRPRCIRTDAGIPACRVVNYPALRPWALLVAVFALTVAVVAAVLAPTTSAAFTARITNTGSSTAAAAYFTCTAAAVENGALFAYPLGDSTGSSAADVSGNNRTGTYQGAVTPSTAQACARDSSGSTVFNGTDGYVSTPTQLTDPETFTEEIWFRTNVAGGELLGFGSDRTGPSTSSDRRIYLNSSSQLVFGVSAGGGAASIRVVTSPRTYTDGTWHYTAATFSPSTGLRLYIDGTLVASDAAVTTAGMYTGFWRIGYDNLTGWPGAPSDNYFTGSLSYAAVYSMVLTATQVAGHYTAGTPATAAANSGGTTSMATPHTATRTPPAQRRPTTTAPRSPVRSRTSSAPRSTSPAPPPPSAGRRTTPTRVIRPRDTNFRGSTARHPAPGRSTRSGRPSGSPPKATQPPGAVEHLTRDTVFDSPTANITCALRATTVSCTIHAKSWATPPLAAACPATSFTTIELGATGPAVLGCSTPTAQPTRHLAYGSEFDWGVFSCRSEPTGMSCDRADSAHGFHLARAGYRIH